LPAKSRCTRKFQHLQQNVGMAVPCCKWPHGRRLDGRTPKYLDEGMAKQDPGPKAAPEKPLSPEAQRALAEAEARRQAAGAPKEAAELRGRGGLDPVRYGDWEVKGIASDF
jgi:hypothetical protein